MAIACGGGPACARVSIGMAIPQESTICRMKIVVTNFVPAKPRLQSGAALATAKDWHSPMGCARPGCRSSCLAWHMGSETLTPPPPYADQSRASSGAVEPLQTEPFALVFEGALDVAAVASNLIGFSAEQ